MPIIDVNHQALRTMAKAIDTYCDTQNTKMSQLDTQVKQMLLSDWTGPDALEFSGKWEGVDGADSTAVKFRDSLKKVSEALTACAGTYQKAQEDIYNLASLLPK